MRQLNFRLLTGECKVCYSYKRGDCPGARTYAELREIRVTGRC